MRLVQLSVPNEQRGTVVDVLRDRGIEYTLIEEAGDREGRSVVDFAVPADAVEHVLAELHEAGIDEDEFTASVSAEFVTYAGVDDLQEEWGASPNKIAPRTLRSKAKDMRLNNRSYVWMMFLATVVATAGLFMESPAIVVGSMVLAPIVSPMLTAGVGVVRDDQTMLVSSIHQQALGLGVAVGGAVLFATPLRWFGAVPATLEIMAIDLIAIRIAPSILALVVGLAAGAAAAFGLATKGQVSLVGVMIAGALIPTAAAAGIALAWMEYTVAVGAILLLVLSIVAINVGVILMLWYLSYRPDEIDESIFSVGSPTRAAVVGATALLVVLAVVGSGAGFYGQSDFERTVNDATTEVLDDEQYEALDIREINVEYAGPTSPTDEPLVTVEIGRPAGTETPELVGALDDRITEETDREVVVEVEYVEYERSE